MKLRNKKTGKVIEWFNNTGNIFPDTLAELNEEWEDYKELSYWYIDNNGDIIFSDLDGDQLWEDLAEERKQIGNYFETKEEAEQAVEKLKAWKRLKDKRFKMSGYFETDEPEPGDVLVMTNGCIPYINDEILEDLEIVFGDEE